MQDKDESAGAKEPAGQPAHAPEQALVASASEPPKVPAGQSVHVAAPASEYVPEGHGTQMLPLAPLTDAKPAWHGVHVGAVAPAHDQLLSFGDLTSMLRRGPDVPAAQANA